MCEEDEKEGKQGQKKGEKNNKNSKYFCSHSSAAGGFVDDGEVSRSEALWHHETTQKESEVFMNFQFPIVIIIITHYTKIMPERESESKKSREIVKYASRFDAECRLKLAADAFHLKHVQCSLCAVSVLYQISVAFFSSPPQSISSIDDEMSTSTIQLIFVFNAAAVWMFFFCVFDRIPECQ